MSCLIRQDIANEKKEQIKAELVRKEQEKQVSLRKNMIVKDGFSQNDLKWTRTKSTQLYRQRCSC